MKLKYEINTIIKYNKELEKSPYTVGIEAIILGNKCLCICNNKNVGCQDAEHKCPKCGYKIGCYYAM